MNFFSFFSFWNVKHLLSHSLPKTIFIQIYLEANSVTQFQLYKYFLWLFSLWLICLMDELLIDFVGIFLWNWKISSFDVCIWWNLCSIAMKYISKQNVFLKFNFNFVLCLFSGKWKIAMKTSSVSAGQMSTDPLCM